MEATQGNQEKWQKFEEEMKEMKAKLAEQQNEFTNEKVQTNTQITQMKAKIVSQEEKCVKELADQQKEFANEKVQVDAKFTQMEAKLSTQKLQEGCKEIAIYEKAQMDAKITQLDAKITQLDTKITQFSGQLIFLQNTFLSLVDRINTQKSWNKKYSDEIGVSCKNDLQLVERRLKAVEEEIQ